MKPDHDFCVSPLATIESRRESSGAKPFLGCADHFAVLGGDRISNTGISTLDGDLGMCGDPSLHGIGGLLQTGVVHGASAFAQAALTDATIAYNVLACQPSATVTTSRDPGGRTFGPGIHLLASPVRLTGTLVLDARHEPEPVFVFQIEGDLTVVEGAAIRVVNQTGWVHVYWQVAGAAELGAACALVGTIIADAGVTLHAAASISYGRVIALNGPMRLESNRIFIGADSAAWVPGGQPTCDETGPALRGPAAARSTAARAGSLRRTGFRDLINRWRAQ